MKTLSVSAIFAITLWLAASAALAQPPLRIREGSNSYGKTTMTVTGDKVRLGNSSYGPVIFTMDGNKIREGNSSYGKVIATVDEHGRVHEGNNSYGRTIANVDGGQVRQGDCIKLNQARGGSRDKNRMMRPGYDECGCRPCATYRGETN